MFFWAARNHDLEIIKKFLANGIDINTQDENGNTALHVATKHRNLDVIKFLLVNNVNINSQNNEGDTPLHVATKHWELELINFLITNGANINIKNNEGNSAWMYIEKNIIEDLFGYSYPSVEISSILTKFPQFLNYQNKFGDSPLMTQIRYRNTAMINFLLMKDVNLNLKNEDDDNAFTLSLIFLPKDTTLHQQLFTPEIAKIIINGTTKKEIATFFQEKDGSKYKYVFTIKKEENGEYTLSKAVISKAEEITAKIFVVDFATNTNNDTQKNSLFELQSLDDSGLGTKELILYLKKIFNQLLPNINYYYPGDNKRPTEFLNANHDDNKLVTFKQCTSDINHKALQLFIAHTMCNLKNDGTVYPISKIYCSQTDDEKITDILQTGKNGNIKQGVLKAFREYQGDGNSFIDFTNEQLNKTHFKSNKIIFQENISCLSKENGKYNSFRGLVVFFEDNNYQQHNNAIIFSKTATSDCNSHNIQNNDYKEFFYCHQKHSTQKEKYLGIIPEIVQLKEYNQQLFNFLINFIAVVKIMDNDLKEPLNKEKLIKNMEENVSLFNNAADNTLSVRTKKEENSETESFNASFINLLNDNVNNKPITKVISL